MDEQQLRDALIQAARTRYEELDHRLAAVIARRQQVEIQLSQVIAEANQVEGMKIECSNWIEAFGEGQFIKIETDDEPEGGDE